MFLLQCGSDVTFNGDLKNGGISDRSGRIFALELVATHLRMRRSTSFVSFEKGVLMTIEQNECQEGCGEKLELLVPQVILNN